MNHACQSCGEAITTNAGEPAPTLCCGCAYARLAELEAENRKMRLAIDDAIRAYHGKIVLFSSDLLQFAVKR